MSYTNWHFNYRGDHGIGSFRVYEGIELVYEDIEVTTGRWPTTTLPYFTTAPQRRDKFITWAREAHGCDLRDVITVRSDSNRRSIVRYDGAYGRVDMRDCERHYLADAVVADQFTMLIRTITGNMQYTTQPQGEIEMPVSTQLTEDELAVTELLVAANDETEPDEDEDEDEDEDMAECVLCHELYDYGDMARVEHVWGEPDRYVCHRCLIRPLSQRQYMQCPDCMGGGDDTARLAYDTYYWDGDYGYCEYHFNEYEEEYTRGQQLIENYSYRPDPVFYSVHENGDTYAAHQAEPHVTYMGFELELEIGELSCAQLIKDAVGDRAYLKEDGSIDNGFEVVSHPHTMQEYRQHFPWDWCEEAARTGARSWSADTCGLHVHVGVTTFESRSHFARWWMLYYRNVDQWIKLAGRRSERWASFGDYYDSPAAGGAITRALGYMPIDLSASAPPLPDYRTMRPKEIDEAEFRRNQFFKHHPNKLAQKGNKGGNRYVALNTNNEHTVELRFWRPSLRHTTILATLEAVDASIEYTRGLRVIDGKTKLADKREALKWDAFRAWLLVNVERYPYVNARIASRFAEDANMSEARCLSDRAH